MNSKWGNSLAIVARNVRSAWRAILSGYLGSYIQEPEGGGSFRGVSAFCVDKLDKLVTHRPPRPPGRVNIVPVDELDKLVTHRPPRPPGRVNIVLCTSVHSLRSAQPFWPGP